VGDFAHQDWIETLMNQGFLGVFLLLNYWWALFMAAYRSYVKRYVNITNIIALFLIIYFTKTMVSMSINDMTIFSTSALAYALAAMDDALIRKDIND
jgi:O-antigen ligase